MATSRFWHDHRYSEEQRTIATQLSRPREMHTLMRSEVSSQRHCPRPAPCGYIWRWAPSKTQGTTIGPSTSMAACFQASSRSTSPEERSRLTELPCSSVEY